MDLNLDNLNKGLDTFSKVIKPYYSPAYEKLKKRKYPENFTPEIVNLKRTGDFHESLNIDTNGKTYAIYSLDVPYAKYIFQNYGGEKAVLGIAKDKLEAAQAITTKALAEEYKKIYTS